MRADSSSPAGTIATLRRSALAWRPYWHQGLVMGDIRRQLFAKLQALSAEFYARWSPGDILARFMADLTVIQAGFTQATFITCLMAISLLINIPVMLWLDWRLAVLSLLSLPLILATNRYFVPRAEQATYQLRQTEGTLANTVQIAAATQDSLRGQMGVVFQENFLFNTSIGENIRLARPEAGQADVEAAARRAEIHDFIVTLPQGYDTKVGEAGGGGYPAASASASPRARPTRRRSTTVSCPRSERSAS
jgi:ABC-type multidrug transport system fused ATPase/permease subunit